MKRIFVLLICMLTTFTASADYTAKIFIEGISTVTNSPTNPPSDSDDTDQEGGEEGHLTYTVSRTTGYASEEFELNINTSSYDCIRIYNVFWEFYTYDGCGRSAPINSIDLATYDNYPGRYSYIIEASNDYFETVEKSYGFDIELISEGDENGGNDFVFEFSKNLVRKSDVVGFYVKRSDYECYVVEYQDQYSESTELFNSCLDDAPPHTNLYETFRPDNYLSMSPDASQIDFVIYGYDLDDSYQVERTSTKHNYTLNFIVPANPVVVNVEVENTQHTTFNTYYYQPAYYSDNKVTIQYRNANRIKLSSEANFAYNTGWITVPFSNQVQTYQLSTDPELDGSYSLLVEAQNDIDGTENFSEEMSGFSFAGSFIAAEIEFCGADNGQDAGWGSSCGVYEDSAAISSAGTGDNFSFNVNMMGANCITISSSNDPNYSSPVRRCSPASNNGVFSLSYPNHDPIGRTQRVYQYTFLFENTIYGTSQTVNYPVTIYYD